MENTVTRHEFEEVDVLVLEPEFGITTYLKNIHPRETTYSLHFAKKFNRQKGDKANGVYFAGKHAKRIFGGDLKKVKIQYTIELEKEGD